MKLTNKEASLLDKVIEQWQEQNLVDEPTAKNLKDSYQSDPGDYKTLSFYAFFAAISCALLAFGALVLDEKWIERMRSYFSFSEFTIGALFAGLAVFLVWYIKRRKAKYINAVWANESLGILLGLSTCISITYFGKAISANSDGYYWLILAAGLALGTEAYLIKSKLLWMAMLLALTGWWTSFSYEQGHPFFLGMNMPLRLLVWSAVLVIVFYVLRRRPWMEAFSEVSYFVIWIMLLSAAWGVSVFGNYDMEKWFTLRQFSVLPWAIGYTLLLAGLLFYAIKQKNKSLRDIVLLFLILNIYTRYFEYFWDVTNKGIFFTILALSFWLVGRKLEQIRK